MPPKESFSEFKNSFLIDYFKLISEFSIPAEKFNNWLLAIIGATVSILIYQVVTLNSYFDLFVIGSTFLGFAIAGFMGMFSKLIAHLAQVSYKSTKNFSDPSYLRYLPLCSEDEFIQFFSKDIKNEILQRIFPRRLRFFSNFVFNKTFSMLKKGVLPYEIPAYFVVLQLFFIGCELFLYFLTIGYVGILFITH